MNYVDSYSYKINPGDNFNIKICPKCNGSFYRFYFNESQLQPKNIFFNDVTTICINNHEIKNTKKIVWS